MWRRKKKNSEPWTPGGIEVYASHEMQTVTIRVITYNGEEACMFTLVPQLAYELAQRITREAIKVEEGDRDE